MFKYLVCFKHVRSVSIYSIEIIRAFTNKGAMIKARKLRNKKYKNYILEEVRRIGKGVVYSCNN